jgi:hypothetical protein
MVLPLIFGLIIIAIVVFVFLRIIGHIALGAVLILLVFVASYLIIGSLPDLQVIPIIGPYLPKLPTSTGEAIAYIRDVFYNIDILSASRDSENNLLIAVANTGRNDVSNFTVFINNQSVIILNEPKDPLKSKEVTVIQTNWKANFTTILVNTNQASATYS